MKPSLNLFASLLPIATIPRSKPRKPPALAIPADFTFFHITHWKAGSQWMLGILNELFCSENVVRAEYFEAQIYGKQLAEQKVYTPIYIGKPEFDSLVCGKKNRRFVLIRDLRDTLTSSYFSFRNTHVTPNPMMLKFRHVLTQLNKEDGMRYMLETWLGNCAHIQQTWLDAGERCYRLEDFMNSNPEAVAGMLRASFNIPVNDDVLKVIRNHSFAKLAGRERGQEDLSSHYRRGIHGDWQNHFTPALKERFKALYGHLLILGGYEKDMNW